ncbi:uncharacterized protein [Aristolochia californica]|uniref:uncharacterized protein n=1 Tax=Aristolochia californica TaxID=171875 RepID=UPI0035D86C6A
MDRLQQDVHITIGQTNTMAVAFWYSMDGKSWSAFQHYSINCDWIPLDISSPSSASGSSWNATLAFTLLLTLLKTVAVQQHLLLDSQKLLLKTMIFMLCSWVFLEMVEKISSAERGEPISNDKDAGATDGSTDKGEVVVNQDTEATEGSSERRELVVNDLDTETTDRSVEKGELVMNDSPMLESKIINTSSELELVTEAIDAAKLDSEVSDSADIRELITADTSSKAKNTIDFLEYVETVVDVNKSGSVTSEAHIGNANAKCSVKSGDLTSLDVTIIECEISDASIMEALLPNTGKVLVEEERLASAIRSDSVEIEEIRSSSVEDVKPEAEPDIDFGKSRQNIATSLQIDVKTEGEVSIRFLWKKKQFVCKSW